MQTSSKSFFLFIFYSSVQINVNKYTCWFWHILLLSLGVMYPHITPGQQENQLCPLRFSAWTYSNWGSFHEEHCKGAWLASHVFVVLTPTHITPVTHTKKKCCSVCVTSLCLCHCFCLFNESLYFASHFVFVYIPVIFIYIYIFLFNTWCRIIYLLCTY